MKNQGLKKKLPARLIKFWLASYFPVKIIYLKKIKNRSLASDFLGENPKNKKLIWCGLMI